MVTTEAPREAQASDGPVDGLVLACGGCGASLVVARGALTATCPFCASPSVVEKPRGAGHGAPRFVVPFAKNEAVARDAFAAWKRRQSIFCRSGIKSASVEKLRGVYVPAWLYSAVTRSDYSASIGENYTVTETYTTTVNGKTVVRTRTRTETEWRPLSGTHVAYASDVIVTGSKAIANAELEAVEPFDMRDLRRFAAGLVAGWIAEEPSLTRDEALHHAHDEAVASVGRALARFMPGDKHRDLRFAVRVEREGVDLMLVPLWVLAVKYAADKPLLRVLINGQTGKAAGKAPLSPVKITLAVVAALGAIGGVAGLLWWLDRIGRISL